MKLEPVVMPREEAGTIVTGKGLETVRKSEIEYYNEDNERSVYSIAPKILRPNIKNSHVQTMLLLPESELRKKLSPNPTLCRLRISFWREFDRAQSRVEDMKLSNINSGICSLEEFHAIVENPNHAAWILKPPADYVNSMEEALIFGIERLREILELPLTKKESLRSGEKSFEIVDTFDSDAANVILKTVALLDMRVKGALVQKVEQKVLTENRNVNATLHAHVNVPQEVQQQIAPEELDRRLLELEKDISKSNKSVAQPLKKSELRTLKAKGVRVEELSDYRELYPHKEVKGGTLSPETEKKEIVITQEDFTVEGL